MAEAKVDISAVNNLLTSLKSTIDEAIASVEGGGTSLIGRRAALEDQNTGCQNSGCGGGAEQAALKPASLASKTR